MAKLNSAVLRSRLGLLAGGGPKAPLNSVLVYCNDSYPISRARFDPFAFSFRFFLGDPNRRIRSNLQISIGKPDGFAPLDFQISATEPRPKDGGTFVTISSEDSNFCQHVSERLQKIQKLAMKRGPERYQNSFLSGQWFVPDILEIPIGPRTFPVLGDVFNEDIASMVPSSILSIKIEGNPVGIEKIYELYRQYGAIADVTQQGSNEFIVRYQRVRCAASARNCTYNFTTAGSTFKPFYKSKLSTKNFVRFAFSNPRVIMPFVIALILSSVITILDPVRRFFMELKYSSSIESISRSLITAVCTKFLGNFADKEIPTILVEPAEAIRRYLHSSVDAVFLLMGPSNTGKSTVARLAVESSPIKLRIDCKKIVLHSKTTSDIANELAKQLGYAVYFPGFNRFMSYIDTLLAFPSGVNSKLASTAEADVENMLYCSGIALETLGKLKDFNSSPPVVIIDNFLSSGHSADVEAIYMQLAKWAAWLVESKIANVLVVADNSSRLKNMDSLQLLNSVCKNPVVKRKMGRIPESLTYEIIKKLCKKPLTDDELKHAFSVFGGNPSEIETFANNFNRGSSVEECLDEMIASAIQKLFEHGFSKNAEMFWALLLLLKKTNDYVEITKSPLFKSTLPEQLLLEFERQQLVSIKYQNGLASTVKLRSRIFVAAARKLDENSVFSARMNARLYKYLINLEQQSIDRLFLKLKEINLSSPNLISKNSKALCAIQKEIDKICTQISYHQQLIDDFQKVN